LQYKVLFMNRHLVQSFRVLVFLSRLPPPPPNRKEYWETKIQHLLLPLPMAHNQLISKLHKTYTFRSAAVNVWGTTKVNL